MNIGRDDENATRYEMTSIDEQIAFIDRRIHAGTDAEFYRGILASLERLKSLDAQPNLIDAFNGRCPFPSPLDAQPVPVEPEIIGWLEHHKAGDNIGWEQVDYPYAKADALIKKSDYDALQSYTKRLAVERDSEKEVRNCTARAYAAEQKRAEKAEALAEQFRKDAERMQEMFSLLASAWFYGGWKAETANEREMQRIMTAAGWWPIESEDELIAKIDRERSAK